MQTLLTTVLHRPYVFAFLAAFLTIGILNRGLGRTLLFLGLGFVIAFLSEYSSIRNGFPYGLYHYRYENMPGELIFGGVPLWDSLSYTFLAYAAYELASWFGVRKVILTTAFLMMLLDVVIDPLAVRGGRWFLGDIFYYDYPGIYFGVPFSNFAGWFLVALAIIGSYLFLEKKIFKRRAQQAAPLLGPLFYWGILAFNLAITFWIGEIKLGLCGLAIQGVAAIILFSLPSSPARRR